MLRIKEQGFLISGRAAKNCRTRKAMFGVASSSQERAKSLLINGKLSYVKFVVPSSLHEGTTEQSKKMVIPAHRFLLAIVSPVFYAMFYNIMAESDEFINIPDCDYQGMTEFLRYIYTEEIRFNGDNILQLLYLAEKYMVPSLTKRCILFLREHLDSSNIFCVLKHSKLIENKSLWRSCWKFIDRKAKDVLESSEFFEMERSDLMKLVKRNTLNVKELLIAINKWAENECEKLGLDATMERRQILGDDIIDNLRFPVMEEKDFNNVVRKINLLTEEETRDVLNNYADNTWPVRFLRHERRYNPSVERRVLYHRGQIWDVFD